jgi:hypothetical protein
VVVVGVVLVRDGGTASRRDAAAEGRAAAVIPTDMVRTNASASGAALRARFLVSAHASASGAALRARFLVRTHASASGDALRARFQRRKGMIRLICVSGL